MSDQYLILSIKHSPWGNDAVWWGPNDSGYTSHIDEAGRYSQEQIVKASHYYNNGKDTRAIPVAAVESMAVRKVVWNDKVRRWKPQRKNA